MTFKIAASRAAEIPSFAARVAAHALESRTWKAHMERVERDAGKDAADPTKHHPFPRPTAPALIEAAVDANGDADYEIFDDGPSPDDVLAKKKIALLVAVSQAEHDAKRAVRSVGKHRLDVLRENDIRMADEERVTEQGKKLSTKLRALLEKDPLAAVREARPQKDTDFLAEVQARRSRMAEIDRKAAEAHAAIEDLTADDVDGFQIPTF